NESTSHAIGIYLNDGIGHIPSAPDFLYPNTNRVDAITAGDLNNDLIMDLAAICSGDSSLVILLGNGDGTFTKSDSIQLPTEPCELAITDFENNNSNDVAIISRYNSLILCRGNGDGTFQALESQLIWGTGTDIEITDLNKDAYPDILIGLGNTPTMSVFMNDGQGNFPVRKGIYTYRTPTSLATGYLDSDDRLDIAIGSGSWDFDNLFILLADSGTDYTCTDTISPGSNIRDITVSDLNKDGRDDIVAVDNYGMYLLQCNDLGQFILVDTLVQEAGFDARIILSTDLNYDGKEDIVVCRDYQISIYYNTGTYTSIKTKEAKMMFFELFQNYPNPFNPSTTITYQIPENGHVKLDVFNVLGQRVKTLVNDFRNAGIYTVEFDGVGLCSGTYFYKLKAGRFFQMRKMVYMR
ncbi:MAG: FG-GAP-like repeat-containing protein, partial [Calditrichaceae bacterium]